MIPNITSILIGPIWSMISDAYQLHHQLMVFALASSMLILDGVVIFQTFLPILLLSIIGNILRSPASSLLDTITMASIRQYNILCSSIESTCAENSKLDYGAFRLWGAISFGIFALIGGLVCYILVDKYQAFLCLFILFSFVNILAVILLLFMFLRQKNERVFTKEESDSSNTTSSSDPNDHTLGSIASFATIVLLSGFGSGVIDSFLFVRLQQLGGSGFVMGVARLITSIAEVPFFQMVGYFHSKLGTWTLLSITQLAFVLRFWYYSILVTPIYIWPCEVLHGLTFAVTWNVSCIYANEISNNENKATAQSIIEGLHFGLGSGLGALVGGIIYDRFGCIKLFQLCAILSFLSFCIALVKSLNQFINLPSNNSSPHVFNSIEMLDQKTQDRQCDDTSSEITLDLENESYEE